jgi:hypothetical protein
LFAGAASVCLGLMQTPARASDDLTLMPTPTGRPLYFDEAAPAAPAPPPPKPLAGELDKLGLKTGPFAIYGYVEGSYTASFNPPPGNVLTGRVFEIADNESVLLNQADLTIEKTVDAAAAAKDGKFDIGGRVEMIYGADSRYIHSNGLNFYGGASPQTSPENQFDPVQAYADFAIPVGNGLTIRAGKFVTLLGYETINPTTNPFYSHSIEFGYGIPFTHTGVLGIYSFTDKLTVTFGGTRGWEQSLKDNNSALDALGQVKYVFSDKVTGYFNFVTGPEQNDNDSLWRTVFDGVLVYSATDRLSFALNPSFGFEPGAGTAGQAAQWYGVAAYSGYKLTDMFTANVRGEWFGDPQGARGFGDNEYEVTVGLAIKPFPNHDIGQNLVIRPELRWDYSETGIFNGGTDNNQWTAAVDAFFTF